MLNYLPKPDTPQTEYDRQAESINATRSNRKPSPENLTDFLLSFARKIDKEDEEAQRVRINSMYAMCRRHRGVTPSDLFGVWNDSGSRWLEHESFADLHGTNVFQSLIRGAEANYTQAQVKLEVKATSNNFQNRSTEKIAKGIYDVLAQTHWTETIEQQFFYAMILKNNGFIISRFNPNKGKSKLKMPQFAEQNFETAGTYICAKCESSGEFTSETGYRCQQCGNEDNLMVMDEPSLASEEIVSFEAEKNAGETETVIADGFDIRFDDSRSECAGFGDAQWLEYSYPCDKEELKRLYPHLKDLDKTPTWTLPFQWKMALKRYQPSAVIPLNEFDKRVHLVREIYLEPNMYADYVSPEQTTIGEYQIGINGMLIEDFPDGIVFGVVNNEVAFLDKGCFKKSVKMGVWLADATSAHGLGAKAGIPIQKKINHLDNLNMEGIDRALRGAIVYDQNAISGTSLEGSNTNIPLRSDFDRAGTPISDYFAPLNVSGLSQDVMMYLQTQMDVIQKVMGVPDAAIGETDPNNKTYGGQILEANRAAGLLVPAKKSQARAMEGWCLDQLRLVQQHYTPERIKNEFGSRCSEDWLDDELEAFLSADLEKAILIKYAEGSEIPQTREQKEAKLAGMLTAGLLPPTPANLNKLVSQSGLDGLDVGDYESNLKVAQKRWTFANESYKQASEQLDGMFQQYQMMINGAVDPMTGQPLPNPVLMQFLSHPTMQVVDEAEEHPIHEDFWKGKTRELLGSSNDPSPLMVEVCRAMIVRHQQGQFAQTTKAQTLAALTQMPVQQGQMAMQDERQARIDDQR